MERLLPCCLVVAVAALSVAPDSAVRAADGRAAGVAAPEGKAADVVTMADGRRYEGLIESESAAWVYLAQMFYPSGRDRFVLIRALERPRIAEIARLAPEERDRLRRDMEAVVHRARIEAGKMDALEIGTAQRRGQFLRHYRGEWFSLDSTTDDATTRRVVVRVEQMFAAYRQILPPRREAQRPLRIVVYGSLDPYRDHLAELGLRLENPSCYVPSENLLLAACEFDKYREALARVDRHHAQLRAELQTLEGRLSGRLQELGEALERSPRSRSDRAQLLRRERVRLEQAIDGKRDEIRRCDRENARAFEQVTGQMFARLYHEASHAYLENYVYPAAQYDVPAWLNEGLATLFERSQLDDDVLRVDAPNPAALKRLRSDLRGGDPLSLGELLSASSREFLETDGTASLQSPRYYAAAWGLVFYLVFERDLLTPTQLDAYVGPAASALPPVERFERWIGQSLAEFEPAWRAYVEEL